MNTKKLVDASTIGSAGEFYTLAVFLRRGFVVGKAPENTADFDLFVMSNDGESFKPIQVKSATDSTHWVLQKKHEVVIKNLFYCFVKFSSANDLANLYIVPSSVVGYAISVAHQIYLTVPGKRTKLRSDGTMRTLEIDYAVIIKDVENPQDYLSVEQIAFIEKYSAGWLDIYENNFDILTSQ